METFHGTDFYTDDVHLSVLLGFLTLFGVGVVGLPGLLATAILRLRHALAHAAPSFTADVGSLRAGPTVLRGVVVGPADEPVVRVSIRQVGSEPRHKDGGQRHRWTEVSREVHASAFELQLASGPRVRVEPGREVFFVGPAAIVLHETKLRSRVASLMPGDTAYVEGVLSAPASNDPYRAASDLRTLRPAPKQRMLISTEPLEQRHVRKAALYRIWAAVLAVSVVVVHAALFAPYWESAWAGKVEAAHVTDFRTRQTPQKNGTATSYTLVVAFDDKGQSPTTFEVSKLAYDEADESHRKGWVDRVPVTVIAGGSTRWIGDEPTLLAPAGILAWFLLLLVGSAFVQQTRGVRAWYERARIVDEGNGPLGEADALV